MSTIHCNYNNDKLREDDWSSISNKCIKLNELDKDENIEQLISSDEVIVDKCGITFDQLDKFFDKIMAHIGCADLVVPTSDEDKILRECYNNIITTERVIATRALRQIFNKYLVFMIVYNTSKECPFKSGIDRRNHDYEYGNADFIFLNRKTGETLHIENLLIHQIPKHHFFQSHVSKYRVDPEKLINFFELKQNEDYSTETETLLEWHLWSRGEIDPTECENITKKSREQMGAPIAPFDVIRTPHDPFGENIIYHDDNNIWVFVKDLNTLPNEFSVTDPKTHDVVVLNIEKEIKSKNNGTPMEYYYRKVKHTQITKKESDKFI